MANTSIYQSIANRTGGDIYIGVVGPVRTGKSTFIKRFMDLLVLPNIADENKRQRAQDELPVSSGGKTIMTTEPKFIPEQAVELTTKEKGHFRVRLIDCVGYIVPSSMGYIENDGPRMVRTPWFDKDVPFNMAAEIGTKKVITDHSTVGLAVTTDGTIGDIPREDYIEAEERVVAELKEMGKPFVVLLNSARPESDACKALAAELSEKYAAAVIPARCPDMTAEEISDVLTRLLYEFPVKEIRLDFPKWISLLDKNHEVRKEIFSAILSAAENLHTVKDTEGFIAALSSRENIICCKIDGVDLATGCVSISFSTPHDLFFRVLSERTGLDIKGEQDLMEKLVALAEEEKNFERFRTALKEVETTGYGIVMPTMEELSLDDPEIMKQGGRYGVRLRASAPSIHMLKANINTEVAPIVGTESQSEELIMYLLKEFEQEPSKIWESNIFGKTLNSLVNEGLHNKLYKMPTEARIKLQETLEKVINEGCSGLICIIL